jgi:hypothetical protein
MDRRLSLTAILISFLLVSMLVVVQFAGETRASSVNVQQQSNAISCLSPINSKTYASNSVLLSTIIIPPSDVFVHLVHFVCGLDGNEIINVVAASDSSEFKMHSWEKVNGQSILAGLSDGPHSLNMTEYTCASNDQVGGIIRHSNLIVDFTVTSSGSPAPSTELLASASPSSSPSTAPALIPSLFPTIEPTTEPTPAPKQTGFLGTGFPEEYGYATIIALLLVTVLAVSTIVLRRRKKVLV